MTSFTSLAQAGEFGLIERIKRQARQGDNLLLGIGDDCSATHVAEGKVLLTSKDLLIEEIHFRRCWTDMYSLGRKSAAVNLSDIAAMGGTPLHLYLGVGLPADLSLTEIDNFSRGFLDESDQAGACLCGGDTCRSPDKLIISVTVQGSVSATEMLSRKTAQEGEALFVSGTLGDSALALALLQRGENPSDFLSQRHHRPTPRLALGQALAQHGIASSMIDVSDGLLSDLGHILKQSGLGAHIDQQQIPLSNEVRHHLQGHPDDEELILQGGEDYELLFSAPSRYSDDLEALSHRLNVPITRIGTLLNAEQGLTIVQFDGEEKQVEARGFNHFRL
ncbi:thiamine-phosphate kinase [uncultured Desulfuromonas sp.]|uniref:thiamine-phosphate kinase n=1 Tax=uncultured Desulfuromonas sp. TaxID=181013 RepID=UPI002AABC8FF|nr:thiamine-phosphate kinase [uncultured Desulfuromonas sp.]